MWPRDRAAFEDYWREGVAKIRMDDVSRRYLQDLAQLRGLPAPVGRVAGRDATTITLGFLPPVFRDELGLPWTADDEARFDAHQAPAGDAESRDARDRCVRRR